MRFEPQGTLAPAPAPEYIADLTVLPNGRDPSRNRACTGGRDV